MPEVSIILPTYNRAKTLKLAIESILNQSYRDFELIIVDDGSVDETECLVRDYMISDDRVKYIKLDKNRGLSAARNVGISFAKGSYIAFQDSDDEWAQEKLMKQVTVLKELPKDVGMVYCFVCAIDEKGNRRILNKEKITPETQDLHRKALMYLCDGMVMQACLFRREVFDICGYFEEAIKTTEDKEFLIRISKRFKFACIDEPLLNYFVTPGSLSKNRPELLKSYIYIFHKYYDDIKKDWLILSKHYFKISRRYKWVGKTLQSKKYKAMGIFFYVLGKVGKIFKSKDLY